MNVCGKYIEMCPFHPSPSSFSHTSLDDLLQIIPSVGNNFFPDAHQCALLAQLRATGSDRLAVIAIQ
jgi:hypothetical protein